MRYGLFEFSNFRGIRHTTLDLSPKGQSPRIFTLVGLNESGKTTVLEAIDHFLPTTEDDTADISPKQLSGWQPPDAFELIPIAERTNFGEDVSVRAVLQLSDDDIEYVKASVAESCDGFKVTDFPCEVTVTHAWTFSNSRSTGVSTKWPAQLGSGRGAKAKKDRPVTKAGEPAAWTAAVSAIRDRLPLIWYFPSDLFDFPDEITLTEGPDETSANRFFRYLFQDILDSLNRGLDTQTHVIERARSADPGDERALRQLLNEAGAEIARSVVSAWSEIFDDSSLRSQRVVVEIVPTRPGQDPANRPVAVKFLLEGPDGSFSVSERSLGFRWFFVYLLVTTYRGQRRANASDMLFLFDEPASNLHPTAQAALLSSLERLSSNAVIIYTTHSHHLVNPAWLSSTYVVANAGVDPTLITAEVARQHTDISVRQFHDFASQSPTRSHYFQPVLDVLDYQPSQLELVPGVVMVEGKTDYYLLRYYCEVVLTTGSLGELHFLPGTGANSLKTLIQLYLGWGRSFVVLLDSDAAGKRAASAYRGDFDSLVEGRILDLSTLSGDGSVTAIESLLTEQERLAFQEIASDKVTLPNKTHFARGVQYAFAGRREVHLSDETRSRLDIIVKALREAIDELAPR